MDVSSLPFPKLKIDTTKSEFDIFSSNFRVVDHKPIIKTIETKRESVKGENLATVVRFVGNDHFKDSDFSLAFHFYYKSLGLAPIDSPEYGLALANRSAVFFAIKNYKACLKDIENVLNSKYPENKLYKIYIRQTECFLKLNQNYNAVQAWGNATRHAGHFNTVKNLHHTDKLQKQIMNIIRTAQVHNELITEGQYPKPELKNGENEKFLGASNAVDLKFNDEKGRHVVANVDIEQGDILFVEEPYSVIRNNDRDDNSVYCSFCLKFEPNSIPCKHCPFHFYCSEECRETAWKNGHKWECLCERKQLFTSDARLLLNVLFEASRNNFDTVVEDESRYGNKKNNFTFINKLVTNKNNMKHEQIYYFTQSAIYIVLYLKKFTDYFDWLHNQPIYADKSMSDLVEYIGGITLKLIMQIHCNHSIVVDIDLCSNCVEIDNIGYGLYASSAMINHSCYPNSLESFDKTLKIVRAVKKIPKDTEITIDYDKYRLDMPTENNPNENICFDHFKFRCKCSVCTDSSVKYSKVPWSCKKCHGKAFPLNNDNYARCTNSACRHIFNLTEYKTMELVIGPNLLTSCFTANRRILENVHKMMLKIYHKENVKFVGYYLTSYDLYLENRDTKKCLEVSKLFKKFTEQFDEVNDISIQASLRLTSALMVHYSRMKLNQIPEDKNVLPDLYSSLNESKRLLTFYVPTRIYTKYLKHVHEFLEQLRIPPRE